MNEIQQWRRMIQPVRARTPAVEHDEPDCPASPATPKRGLKPKISSYFTHHSNTVKTEPSFASLNEDPFAPRLPAWPGDEPYPRPNAEALIDSIMCRILPDPYGRLGPRFNGTLLHIFETFRNVCEDKVHLQAQLDEQSLSRKALLYRLQQAQKQWSEERQDYKDEIKRLELLLAKGKRGLAEVTIARQDSQLRQRESVRRSQPMDDGLQVIFEAIDRTNRYAEKAWSNQRAVFRPRQLQSPFVKMRRLSQQLSVQTPHTEMLANLRDGTPPGKAYSSLAEAATHEAWQCTPETFTPKARDQRATSEPKTSMSDDTFSTFSCTGDLLPDETGILLPHDPPGVDDELAAVRDIATTLARRRDVDVALIMPKLCDLFDMNQLPTPTSCAKSRPSTSLGVNKQPSLMAKASGLFHKLRASNVNTAIIDRFSFEPGDDLIAYAPATTDTVAPCGSLSKSLSLSSLRGRQQPVAADKRTLPPGPQSPTTSSSISEKRRQSRIPTPLYSGGVNVRPRRKHEASSYRGSMTASDETESARTTALATISPPAPNRLELLTETQGSQGELTSVGNDRIPYQSTMARGNAFAAALARSHAYGNIDLHPAILAHRSESTKHPHRSLTAVQTPDMSEKENRRPMASMSHHVVDDDEYAAQ